MRKLFPLVAFVLLSACSHHTPATYTTRHPASLTSLDLKILETEKYLEKLQQVQNGSGNMVLLDYIDSGLDKSKRRYDIHAEILSNNPTAITKAEVYIDNKYASDLTIVHEQGRSYIKHKVMFKLKLHNTKIRIYFTGNGYKDNDLVCTRAGKCL